MPETIIKSGGILLQDKKLLVTRTKNKVLFKAPGGRIEKGETPTQALIREIKEELNLTISEENISEFGKFQHTAAEHPDREIIMTVFVIDSWTGIPEPHTEIDEIKWIDSHIPKDLKVGSIFEFEVIPRLKEQNLID